MASTISSESSGSSGRSTSAVSGGRPTRVGGAFGSEKAAFSIFHKAPGARLAERDPGEPAKPGRFVGRLQKRTHPSRRIRQSARPLAGNPPGMHSPSAAEAPMHHGMGLVNRIANLIGV